MSSRRSVRKLLVAVLLGVLVGGGLMAVTPAGAEVSTAVATNWKKIWKKNLKPLAKKSFYTKKQSKRKFQPKGDYETAGSGYSKAESDVRYYGKAEIDAKLAPFVNSVASFAGGDQSLGLTAAPQVVRSVSIMPPADGNVIVSSNAYIIATSASATARCSLTTGTSIDFNFLQFAVITDDGDTEAIAGTRGYPATKGVLLTVNLVCSQFAGTSDLRDSAMTAIFAPS